MPIVQTSAEGYGQIYVGAVNWMLMLVTIALTITFKTSDSLAAAYGIAVSATMLMTTVLLYIAMREIWHWSVLAAGSLAGAFLIVDSAFFLANATKITQGGYIPIILALAVFSIMYIWHEGLSAIGRQLSENRVSIGSFMQKLKADKIARVPGTAIFLTRSTEDTPPIIIRYVNQARALHEKILAVTIKTALVPWVDANKRFTTDTLAPNFCRCIATYGFMERPNLPDLLAQLNHANVPVDLADAHYFVGLEAAVSNEKRRGLPRWFVTCFAFLLRNSERASDRLSVPEAQVTEIVRRIAI